MIFCRLNLLAFFKIKMLVCWLVGWFWQCQHLVGLYYAQISLTIIVSNFIKFKNISLQSF